MNDYYVYILSNWNNKVLYVGVTGDIKRRINEHKNHKLEGFTSRYNVNKLVYLKRTSDITEAIKLEKKLKGWTRQKKFELIKSINPDMKDLAQTNCHPEH